MIRFLQTKGPFQKVLLIGFLTIVCVMMVVTLIPGGILNDITGGGSVSANAVAKVEGQEVTNQEVDLIVRNMMQQRHYPEQFRSLLMPQAVDAAVIRHLYLAEAKRLNLLATDDDLRYEMQHGQMSTFLFPNGNFVGADQYREMVSSQFNMTVPQFETELRDQLSMRKLRTVLSAGVFVSNDDVRQLFMRIKTKAKFEYAVLTAAELEKSVTINDAELHAYYEKNQQQFANTIPEQRRAKIAIVNPGLLPNPPKVSNDQVVGYYRQHAAEYRVPESVNLRHILIKLPLPGPDGKVDPKQVDAVKAKAQDVLKQLRGGANFADVAKKSSDDSGTADKGGVVGELVQGSGTAPEIEKVAFTLNPGQVSDLIQTSYGFEIVRVDSKVSAHARPLEEVRSNIEQILGAQEAERLASELARKVETQAKSVGLDKAAADNGVHVSETAFFSRNEPVPGIGPAPQLAEAIFSMKLNAPPATAPFGANYAVAQLLEIKPPATPSFDQVKDRIVAQLKQQKAQALLAQKAQELSDKARSTGKLDAAAKAVGASFKTSDPVTPDGQVPDLGQVSSVPQLFEMKPGEVSQPVSLGQKAVVVKLLEKTEPTEAEFQASKDQIKEELLQQKRNEVEEVVIASLKDRLTKEGRIVIDKKKLAALGGNSEQ